MTFDFNEELAKRDAENSAHRTKEEEAETTAKDTAIKLSSDAHAFIQSRSLRIGISSDPNNARTIIFSKESGDTLEVTVHVDGTFAVEKKRSKKPGFTAPSLGGLRPLEITAAGELMREIAGWCGV